MSPLHAPSLTPWIGPDGQRMQRLELHLTYTCPERCVFCSEEHRLKRFSQFDVTFGRVARVLRNHASRGITSVHLTGGEPTIHPRFLDVLGLARRLGMRTSIGTIGTMLSRPAFAERAVPLLDEALFSLHGPDAETHDALAGRGGSFERVVEAMRRTLAIDPGFGLFVNTVLTRRNLDVLPDTVAHAAEQGAKLIVISNTTPEGGGLDRFEELAPRLDELADVLGRAVPRAGDAVLRIFGVPMCLLGESAMLSNDLHWDPRVTVEWSQRPDRVVLGDVYSWDPGRKRRQMEACSDCARRDVCMGVWSRYAELWPTDRLEPIS